MQKICRRFAVYFRIVGYIGLVPAARRAGQIVMTIQIFGVKNSQATRAAERFFKERRVAVQFLDLKKKPMSPGEIKRFIDRFGLAQLLDTEGAPYADAGLKYMKMSDAELLGRVEQEPRLLRLPLVRFGNLLSIGQDDAGWKAMLPGT